MKVLSLHQPWTNLVALGKKKIETRSWGTNYRGPLGIQAAKYFPMERQILSCSQPFVSALFDPADDRPTPDKFERLRHEFYLGHIICTCNLVDCVEMTVDFIATIQEPELSFGLYEIGRYAWLLSDVEILEKPIQTRGYQGLWNFNGRAV